MLGWLSKLLTEKPPTHPSFQKNHQYFSDFDQSEDISSYEFTVVDTELTGMQIKSDEILSIGAVKIKNLQIINGQTFYSLVKPQKHIFATNATMIHQLTPNELSKAPSLPEVLPQLIDFCGSSLMVGHYINLDWQFINKACKKHFQSTIKTPALDTLRLAQIYTESTWGRHTDHLHLQISYNLSDLCKTYGLPLFKAHNALQDAMQTAYLFLFLIKTLQKDGLSTLQDFYRAGQRWNRLL